MERRVLEPGATSRRRNEPLYHAMKEEQVRHDIHDVDGKRPRGRNDAYESTRMTPLYLYQALNISFTTCLPSVLDTADVLTCHRCSVDTQSAFKL